MFLSEREAFIIVGDLMLMYHPQNLVIEVFCKVTLSCKAKGSKDCFEI